MAITSHRMLIMISVNDADYDNQQAGELISAECEYLFIKAIH